MRLYYKERKMKNKKPLVTKNKPLTTKELAAATKKIDKLGVQLQKKLARPKPVGKIIKPEHIEAVKAHLPRGKEKAITITSLARKLRCSKAAAERRLNAYLEKHGILNEKLKSVPVREGDRGPMATGFYL